MSTGEATRNTVKSGLPDAPVLLAFIVSVFLIGTAVIAIRFTVMELAPFWGATLRFAAATAIFGIIMLIRRTPLPRGRTLGGLLLYGILGFGLSYALAYFAIREMTAGFSTVIMSLMPLLTFLFAVLHRLEPFRWLALLGTLLALVGIALAFAGQEQGSTPLWAVLFMVAAAVCFAESTVILKMLPPISPVVANAVGMGTGSLFLAILSLIAGESWLLPQETQTWLAVIYLIVFGSVIEFYLTVYVIQRWTVTAASYLIVLAPFVTVPLAALLADEQITAGLVLGALVVLAAVFIGALSSGKDKQAGVEEPLPEG